MRFAAKRLNNSGSSLLHRTVAALAPSLPRHAKAAARPRSRALLKSHSVSSRSKTTSVIGPTDQRMFDRRDAVDSQIDSWPRTFGCPKKFRLRAPRKRGSLRPMLKATGAVPVVYFWDGVVCIGRSPERYCRAMRWWKKRSGTPSPAPPVLTAKLDRYAELGEFSILRTAAVGETDASGSSCSSLRASGPHFTTFSASRKIAP